MHSTSRPIEGMSPYALLGSAFLILRELVQRQEISQADRASIVLLGNRVNELRGKYIPKAPRVTMAQQMRMVPGAPEAEQAALLGEAG